ncbi:putative monovalent cation/H+ antiporter [Anaplasma centrale str. Israel]|uniref:Putative monovalent cation/H+ antiporter n=1 Tax=Anaplasma centrale (strain Israel) TaxID=574556 RepID=D1ASQ3_ANACI|nr:Na+/H+ antiporter subunit E [Anaplasma centrale]ACZ49506.1 putative monovalent cation/H+ antiporter [Anaplasma centrale str. Israel]
MSILGLLLIQMMLWVVFSGYFDVFFLSAGVVSSLLSVFVCHVIGVRGESGYIRYALSRGDAVKFVRIIFLYLPWIFGQAVLSAWFVVKRVCALNVRDTNTPVMVLVDTTQDSGLGAFMLASSITLTPGTVGMNVTRDYKVEVLALEQSLVPGISEIDSRVSAVLGDSVQPK